MHKIICFVLVLFLSMSISVFAQEPSQIIVAKINDMPITLEDLNKAVEKYNDERVQRRLRLPDAYFTIIYPPTHIGEMRTDMGYPKITTREEKINFLKNEMIRTALFYQEALRRGLDKKEEIRSSLLNKSEREIQDILSNALREQEIATVQVSSKEIEGYYNIYKEYLRVPEERRIREIVVPKEQEAKDICIKLLQGEDFATLAKTHSVSPSAQGGGDLGFIKKGTKSSIFDSIAFSEALKVGKLSQIFEVSGSFCILRLEDIGGGQQKSLSEMRDEIKNGLLFAKQAEKIDSLVHNLSREAKIEIYEDKIK